MPGYEIMGKEELDAINRWFGSANGVLFAHGFVDRRNGNFKVRELEKALAARFNVRYAQVVSSGTAALYVALVAMGVKPGDEVITSSFTFVATVEAIIMAGAKPVLTEVDKSLCMDPVDLERLITGRTKVIIPVHMAGAPADMDVIHAISRKHGIKVLEDAAQISGGTYKGKHLGTIGDAGIFSFDFAKNITTGEGGAILTNDEDIYKAARSLHDHGHDYNTSVPRGKDTRKFGGFNFRMTEIQAVIGLEQLKKLDTIIKLQRENKKLIKEMLMKENVSYRTLNDQNGEIADTIIFYATDEKKALQAAQKVYDSGCTTKNLPDAIDWHFAGTWDHMLSEYSPCKDKWPRTAKLLRSAIAIPVNANMTRQDIERYAFVIKASLSL